MRRHVATAARSYLDLRAYYGEQLSDECQAGPIEQSKSALTPILTPCATRSAAFYDLFAAIVQSHMESPLMGIIRREGAQVEGKGTAREVEGKVRGKPVKELAGKIEKHAGRLEKTAGKVVDGVRNAVRNPR